MPENCTLFCRIKPDDFDSFKDRLPLLQPVHIMGHDWTSVDAKTNAGNVQFTGRQFESQADPFSLIVGQTMVFFDQHKEKTGDDVTAILSHLETTEFLLGVVANPTFEAISHLEALLLFLAVEYDALIFNGTTMLDATGSELV